MKKYVLAAALILLIVFMPVSKVYGDDALVSEAENINEILDDSSGGILSESEISVENAESILKTDIKGFLIWLKDRLIEEIKAPARMSGILFSVIIFSSLFSGLYLSGKKSSFQKTAEMISVLAAVSVISGFVGESLDEACRVITDGSSFMLAFVPVMSGVMTAQGNVTSAGSYQLLTAGICEMAAQLVSSVFLPCLSACFSVSIVDAAAPELSLDGLVKGVRKTVSVLLGLVMTLFTGMITVQNTAGSAADSLSVKTGRYLVANLVPVVGKAVSDSYAAVRGSIGVLRTGVGSTGIAVLFLMTAVPVLRLFLYRIVIGTAEIISDAFGCTRLKKLFSGISVLYGIVIATVMVFMIMMITSTAVVMRSYTGE